MKNILYSSVLVFLFFELGDMAIKSGHGGFSLFLNIISWIFIVMIFLQLYDILINHLSKFTNKQRKTSVFSSGTWKGSDL